MVKTLNLNTYIAGNSRSLYIPDTSRWIRYTRHDNYELGTLYQEKPIDSPTLTVILYGCNGKLKKEVFIGRHAKRDASYRLRDLGFLPYE